MASAFTQIEGGVTAPRGFRASAVRCGIKSDGNTSLDLALVASEVPAVAAATFTTNRIKAAPVRVSANHLRSPETRAVVVNSGNANACTGTAGIQNAKRMAKTVGQHGHWPERQTLVCSTGRIGRQLPIEKIELAIPELVAGLGAGAGSAFARAILTSDTFHKEVAIEFSVADQRIRIGGAAKGAGMIDPNMATMLCFVTTDAAIEKRNLQRLFAQSVEQSFNCITVDGDMSTNDTAICLANGSCGVPVLSSADETYSTFGEALNFVTRNLARMIVEDGEGVTKFVEVHVKGAATYQDARKAAEAIANSKLLKCSWYGEDPNWGRIMAAVGYSSARVREEMLDIFLDGVVAVEHGMASSTPEEKLKEILRNEKFTVTVDLHLGSAEYRVFTTDLTPEYVRFNMGE
ncbi:MAG: bifunctional glutamate N-acetyltransferase/amino-acid acetyltransferase ArgJ [Verrucomicrobia bacterium]|nr:bifunctional glutamate N-acetyltransferase/amino-acid acetyltransferase ArgJ [Verrucomicrobiota bacterium]MBV9275852.1 bifunctional glutamate N-acetyltransferase/amino-acid acetyltransferase ArgJ [Verrucomicrobiota bacterium]